MSAVAPEGRRLLRIEARNAQTPIEHKPPWIKVKASMGPEYTQLRGLVEREGLHTVCQEAGCPNIYECWEDREATFLIGGDQCTRRCDFRQIHHLLPGCGMELLIPDFNAQPALLAEVFGARPEVLAHNVETVPRIFKRIRPGFRYARSLEVITRARDAGLVTKSNLILGMGETPDEVTSALRDLHEAGCEIITITQYLRPSVRHHPVDRWVKPQEFVELKEEAEQIGFSGVMSGPLVRSSYRAGRLYRMAVEQRGAFVAAQAV